MMTLLFSGEKICTLRCHGVGSSAGFSLFSQDGFSMMRPYLLVQRVTVLSSLFVTLSYATGCSDDDQPPADVVDAAFDSDDAFVDSADATSEQYALAPASVSAGDLTASLDPESGVLTFSLHGIPILTSSNSGSGAVSVTGAVADVHSVMQLGSFQFEETARESVNGSTVISTAATEDNAQFVFGLGDSETVDGNLTVIADGVIQLTLTAPERLNRLQISFACSEMDGFLGFGAQSNAINQRGRIVPIWLSEPGIGKYEEDDPSYFFSMTGRPNSCAYPLPYFINPVGYGLAVDTVRYSSFDLCSSDTGAHSVEVWDNELALLIIAGPEPLTVIERYTEIYGRQRPPAEWAFAPWNDAIHGPEEVLRVAGVIRDNHIPSTSIWTEDWIGGRDMVGGYHLHYHWEADTELYPDLPGLSATLHEQGFRFLAYFNPFVGMDYPEWDEGAEGGWLMQNAQGEPYPFTSPLMETVTLVDLTTSDGVDWLHGYLQRTEALGFDGWMVDYAEWVPFNAYFGAGETGESVHNQYPVLWQEAHRTFWDEARPDGDYLFFTRSGFTGSAAMTDVMWAGDQNTDWKPDDGLPSLIPMGLNVGFAGLSTFGHDIGGYTSLGAPPTTRELFFRWVELGAWTPIMRTHHGTADKENWHFDEDEETLEHYKRYAVEHIQLFPYFYALALEAEQTGRPIMRHPFLHFPNDSAVLNVIYEFLLGPFVYVAPVIEEGATTRTFYLPEGRWTRYTSGDVLQGGQEVTVDAPLTEIPVFMRAGAVIPRLPDDVETLAPAEPPIVDLDDRSNILWLDVYLGDSSSFTLADGTSLQLESELVEQPSTIQLAGVVLAVCSEGASDCIESSDDHVVVLVVEQTEFEIEGLAGDDSVFTLTVASGTDSVAEYRVTVHF